MGLDVVRREFLDEKTKELFLRLPLGVPDDGNDVTATGE